MNAQPVPRDFDPKSPTFDLWNADANQLRERIRFLQNPTPPTPDSTLREILTLAKAGEAQLAKYPHACPTALHALRQIAAKAGAALKEGGETNFQK